MSTPTRSVNEIQNEYAGLCSKAGHIQYQIYTLQKDIEAINATLRNLNAEAYHLKAQETAAAPAAVTEASNG